MCDNSNVECVGINLYRCNDCGHKFFGEYEDIEGNRAGYSRQAEAEDYKEQNEDSEGDGLMTMDDDDILFPPEDF
jgi:hypothetical protein